MSDRLDGLMERPDPQVALDPRRWRALALLGTAFFMVILDGTIVLTAVPSMKEDLGFSAGGVQWVITAYALAFGGSMLFWGRAADVAGRRRVFMAGVGVFTAASLLCGLAWSAPALVAARTAQGLAAAAMAPAALSIVMTTFEQGAERNKALGVWGALGGVGATAGLLIGGSVTSALGWPWVFLLNVPVGVAALALSPTLLHESRDTGPGRPVDPVGAVTVTAALALLVYALSTAPNAGWASTRTVTTLTAASVLLIVFVVIQARTAKPLVPRTVLRVRTVLGGNAVIFSVGMAVDAMLFILTLYAQQVLGYSAVQFGLMTAVMTVMAIVGALVGQHLVTRTGLGPVAVTGTILISTGCLALARVSAGGSYLNDVFVGLLVFGPGMGAAFVSAQISSLTGVPDQESGLASALVDTSFNLGAALGIAIASTVAISRTNELRDGAAVASGEALTAGFRSAFVVAAGFAVLALIASFALPRRQPADANPHAHDSREAASHLIDGR